MTEVWTGGGADHGAEAAAGSMRVAITVADGPADIAAVHALFVEYAQSLGFSLCFQNFDDELATLPGKYGPPRGRLLLARDAGGTAIGVVGVRPIADGICEMKRLYVVPAARRLQLGRRLAVAAVAAGAELGYAAMRLDTHASFTAAIPLYRSLGFGEIPPYYANPLPNVVYFERGYGPSDESTLV